MLGTIKVPLNMNLLHGNLPQSNYETDKPKRDKKKKDSILHSSDCSDVEVNNKLGKI